MPDDRKDIFIDDEPTHVRPAPRPKAPDEEPTQVRKPPAEKKPPPKK
jgi:hypothetical protein